MHIFRHLPIDPAHVLAFAVGLIGLLVNFQATEITEWLGTNLVPLGGLVRSMGTYYPGFLNPEQGFSYQLRFLGVLIFFTPPLWLFFRSTSDVFFSQSVKTEIPDRAIAALIGLIGFFVYAYLAYPPYTFPTNFRIHWVDIHFSWQSQWIYALPKIVNPLFDDAPHILTGIYGSLSSTLFYLCLRKLKLEQLTSALCALSFVFASNLLIFATVAEDINLSIATLLLCVYCFLAQHWRVFGLSIFVTFLARPTNLIFPAFLLPVFYLSLYQYSPMKLLRSPLAGFRVEPGLLQAIALALIPAVMWNGYLIFIDQHFLIGNGSNALSNIAEQRSIKVDGFTISRFSGAILLHHLWVFPITVTAAAIFSLLTARKSDQFGSSFIIAAIATVAANIALVEYLKMWYFNIRYITYFYPLMMLAAFAGIKHGVANFAARTSLLVLLAISSMSTYNYSLNTKKTLSENPLSLAFEERDSLQTAVQNCAQVWTDHGSNTERNAISYLLSMDKYNLRVFGNAASDSMSPQDCLVSARPQTQPFVPIYEGNHVSVFKFQTMSKIHID